MQKLINKFLLFFGVMMLASCAQDPSIYDLKSPCVDSGTEENSPCVKRSPIENAVV